MDRTPEPLAKRVRMLQTGDRQPAEYLATIRARFERLDPDLQAFVDEQQRWDRLATEYRHLADPGIGARPPCFGVPVGIKDIIHVEGLETRAGADLPLGELTGTQASVVTALTAAGALVLGKTVTTEFAYFAPGPTRNPHDLGHTPGGSSSGSAAAVAAGYCPLALGTQTIGSINRPAAFCGVVGFKPSYGRIPTDGIIPVAPSVDTLGWFTQDVAGAQLAGGVLCPNWRAEDRPARPPRVGAVSGPYLEQASPTALTHFETHVAALEDAGILVGSWSPFPDLEDVNQRHHQLVAAETALSHAEWYPRYRERYSETLSALIETGAEVTMAELGTARVGRADLREHIHTTMDDHDLDVLISPAAPGPAPAGIDSTGDPIMNLPWTHAGLPTVTIPASKTADGLPLGLQCTARFGFDEWLLAWVTDIRDALGE